MSASPSPIQILTGQLEHHIQVLTGQLERQQQTATDLKKELDQAHGRCEELLLEAEGLSMRNVQLLTRQAADVETIRRLREELAAQPTTPRVPMTIEAELALRSQLARALTSYMDISFDKRNLLAKQRVDAEELSGLRTRLHWAIDFINGQRASSSTGSTTENIEPSPVHIGGKENLTSTVITVCGGKRSADVLEDCTEPPVDAKRFRVDAESAKGKEKETP
ncbi:hypothetical protein AAF712_008657 [Marasmius tenuissimus]|uniref:Uncharacterized protein n=1 Tax=Marasmius tenuissimus TaxID=585030 RepID=A0ABR2ZTE3_9AGAR